MNLPYINVVNYIEEQRLDAGVQSVLNLVIKLYHVQKIVAVALDCLLYLQGVPQYV